MAIGKLFAHWTLQALAPGALLKKKYTAFRELLAYDDQCLGLIAELEDMLHGPPRYDWARAGHLRRELSRAGKGLVDRLQTLNPGKYRNLKAYFRKLDFYGELAMDITPQELSGPPHILPLEQALDPLWAGGKAANLARVAAGAGFSTPPGVVVGSPARQYFLEHNHCRERLDELLAQVDLEAPEQLDQVCGQMRNLILRGRVPADLSRDLLDAARDLAGEGHLAIRSSAVGEDGRFSFAGQYDSLLNVPARQVATAYQRVLAGQYTTRAVAYRIMNGLADQETPMAVLMQPMVRAEFSGVAYSGDPGAELGEEGPVTVFAVPGTAQSLVGGTQTPHAMSFDRNNLARAGEEGSGSGMDATAFKNIAETVLALEQEFSVPQDVEWALGQEGAIHILQSRPLCMERAEAPERPDTSGLTTLQSGLARISYGAGAGPVHHAEPGERYETIPVGAVLVVRVLAPELAAAVGRAAAVVAEVGSRAGHFASVAREHGVPTVAGADIQALPETGILLVDADQGVVFQGEAGLIASTAKKEPAQTPLRTRLGKAIQHIAHLNLTDPRADNFCPEGIRSMHDLVRFAHEQGVAEMFALVGDGGRGLGKARKLESPLPLVMYILDLGGGLDQPGQTEGTTTPERFRCPAMAAFWQGLADPGEEWDPNLTHVDWKRFDEVSGGIVGRESRLLASYAVLSEDYAHLLVRFGYHFSVVDALCGDSAKNNHVSFSFRGGGGGHEQRRLRLAFIEDVLAGFGFDITIQGDLLEASFSRAEAHTIQEKLRILGRLCAHTRLMDMALTDKVQVEDLARRFSAVLAEQDGQANP